MKTARSINIQVGGKDYNAYLEEHEILDCGTMGISYVCKAIIKSGFEPFHGFKTGNVLGRRIKLYCGDTNTVIEAESHSTPLL